jgi:hypothetical protein
VRETSHTKISSWLKVEPNEASCYDFICAKLLVEASNSIECICSKSYDIYGEYGHDHG